MYEEIRPLVDLFRDFSMKKAVSVLDILLVAYVLYKLFSLIRGARAWRILIGIALFVAVLFLAKALQLHSLYWLMDKATLLGPVALVILLLPELRQAIEGFGRFGVWTQWLVNKETAREIQASTIEELVAAVAELSARKIGALIVLERHYPLDEVVENGVLIGAKVSKPLLVSIFYGANPLHDGAVVIRGDEVVCAASRLPLSESTRLDPQVHMRHRAAVGVAELYDCIPVVVSEERGSVSVVIDGRLVRVDEPSGIRDILNREWRQVKSGERTKLTLLKRRSS